MSNYLLIAVFVAFVEALGIVAAMNAAYSTRTAQGAVAWSLSLIFMPFIALPFYWVLGPRKFHSYRKALEEATKKRRAEIEQRLDDLASFRTTLPPELAATQRCYEKLTEQDVTKNNDVKLLIDGEETFAAIFDAIQAAQEYILISFYIVRDDDLGTRLKNALIAKRLQGVRVFFLYDQIGSMNLSDSYIRELREAGVAIDGFRTTKGRKNRFRINFRNHRKIVVVDGRVGFVGGHNVGDEYLGKDPQFGRWRDTHVEVTGPLVQQLQIAFAKDWYWATETPINAEWKPTPAKGADMAAIALATGPTTDYEDCSLMFLNAITTARERIWIASPYFVPDTDIRHALQMAALRGVDVRILVPERSDSALVWLAGLYYSETMVSTGVKIYNYVDGFLHHKVMLVDHSWGAVGTANLDNRSFRLNFELTIAVFDKQFAAALEEMFDSDLRESELKSAASFAELPIHIRVLSRIARLFAPIL